MRVRMCSRGFAARSVRSHGGIQVVPCREQAESVQQDGTHEEAILPSQDVVRKRNRAAGKGSGQGVVVVG